MKRYLPKQLTQTVLLCAGLSLASPSYALATLDDVVNSVNGVIHAIGVTANMLKDLMFQDTPNITETIQANKTIVSANTKTTQIATKATLSNIEDTLSIDDTDPDETTISLTGLYATGSLSEPDSPFLRFGPEDKPSITAGDANFSIDSLLGPIAYNKDQARYASNYINFAGDLIQPLSTLDLSRVPEKKQEELGNTDSYEQYMLALRSAVASRSAGLNSLYAMEAERTVSPGLGAAAGLSQANMSPLQLKQYMATRRSTNPEWFVEMEQAAPATLQRETLFLMAEMRQEMFENRMMMERLVALMSLQHVQNANTNARLDLATKQQAVEKAIDNILSKDN